jgi:non-homologous end joining protein Ku
VPGALRPGATPLGRSAPRGATTHAVGHEHPGRNCEDEYRETLLKIIRAEAEGKEVEPPAKEKPPAKVRNLMDALRQSVDAVRKPLPRRRGVAPRARPASAAASARCGP